MRIDFKKHSRLLEKALSLLGAFVYIVFAATFAKDMIVNHRISSLFPLFMTSIFVYFFLVRDLPRQLNLSPYDWFITLVGTFLPLCLRPAPVVHDNVVLLILQSVGTCISIAGILSLNKSIGLAPANRGVKTFFAYEYIRHPIYAGYFLSLGAYALENLTWANIIICVSWMTCETLRLFAEEKYLSQDPAYTAYMKKVRWRLIPYIF